jgi:hypothetical protein
MDELEQLRLKLMSNKKWHSEQYRVYAARSIDQKQKQNGKKLLRKAILLNPFSLDNFRTLFYLIKS